MKHIIANLKSSFDGQPWYGTSLMDIIEEIEYDQVNLIPVNGSNSAVKLVSHIIVWREFVIEKLQGNSSYDIVLNTPEDWPTRAVKSEDDWKTTIVHLRNTQDKLVDLLESLPEGFNLDRLVPGKDDDPCYTHYYMLSGLIQHDTYHLGQMALTWKLTKSS